MKNFFRNILPIQNSALNLHSLSERERLAEAGKRMWNEKFWKKIDKNFVSSKIGCNFAELSAQEKWASEKSRKANEHWKIYNRDEVVQEQLKL